MIFDDLNVSRSVELVRWLIKYEKIMAEHIENLQVKI